MLVMTFCNRLILGCFTEALSLYASLVRLGSGFKNFWDCSAASQQPGCEQTLVLKINTGK